MSGSIPPFLKIPSRRAEGQRIYYEQTGRSEMGLMSPPDRGLFLCNVYDTSDIQALNLSPFALTIDMYVPDEKQ
jgi:hypothetical protein